MSADTESGLAVGHLLKMHAKGDITTAEFKQYTRNVIGFDPEVPIECGGDKEEAEAEP